MRLIDLDSIPWEIRARKRREIPDENNDKWVCGIEYAKVAYENDVNEMPVILKTIDTGIIEEKIFQYESLGISATTNMVTLCLSNSALEDLKNIFDEKNIIGVSVLFQDRKYKLTQFEYDLLSAYPISTTKFKNSRVMMTMKEKGHFEDIKEDEQIKDILENCEVIDDD